LSWERIASAPACAPSELPARLTALLCDQRQRWAALRAGEAALAGLRTRVLHDEGAWILAQANPGRRASTEARLDPGALAARPCFLCPEHLPPEERGLAFGELVLLPNPFPVLPDHCTVPARVHAPQRLAGRLEAMLALAQALGPAHTVFYNGPRCGASAPDHAHFQVVAARAVPLFEQLPLQGLADERRAWECFGRRMLLAAHRDPRAAHAYLESVLRALAALQPGGDEPMLNLLVLQRQGRLISVVFPRRAHRPACFFAEGAARLAVSPAALEMAGVLVVPEPEQLDRLGAPTARAIYEEVCLEAAPFARLAEELA
jgi:hypothetical protein